MFYTDIILKQKQLAEDVVAKLYDDIYNILTVPCEKSKTVSFTSSVMKNIVVSSFPSQARSPVKLICCIAFRSASSACCLLKSISILY